MFSSQIECVTYLVPFKWGLHLGPLGSSCLEVFQGWNLQGMWLFLPGADMPLVGLSPSGADILMSLSDAFTSCHPPRCSAGFNRQPPCSPLRPAGCQRVHCASPFSVFLSSCHLAKPPAQHRHPPACVTSPASAGSQAAPPYRGTSGHAVPDHCAKRGSHRHCHPSAGCGPTGGGRPVHSSCRGPASGPACVPGSLSTDGAQRCPAFSPSHSTDCEGHPSTACAPYAATAPPTKYCPPSRADCSSRWGREPGN